MEPGEGALDNAASWQKFKALYFIGSANNLVFSFADFEKGRSQFLSCIPAIGKDMAQPWIAVTDRSQNAGRTIPILNIGRVNNSINQKALRVCHDMSFASFDLSTSVEALDSKTLCRLYTLAIDNSCRRRSFSSNGFSYHHKKCVIDRKP